MNAKINFIEIYCYSYLFLFESQGMSKIIAMCATWVISFLTHSSLPLSLHYFIFVNGRQKENTKDSTPLGNNIDVAQCQFNTSNKTW